MKINAKCPSSVQKLSVNQISLQIQDVEFSEWMQNFGNNINSVLLSATWQNLHVGQPATSLLKQAMNHICKMLGIVDSSTSNNRQMETSCSFLSAYHPEV